MPLVRQKNFDKPQFLNEVSERGGHGGGDRRLHDKIFKNSGADDPLKHSAGIRDGVMSVLVDLAARKRIKKNATIKISSLTGIKPTADRP